MPRIFTWLISSIDGVDRRVKTVIQEGGKKENDPRPFHWSTDVASAREFLEDPPYNFIREEIKNDKMGLFVICDIAFAKDLMSKVRNIGSCSFAFLDDKSDPALSNWVQNQENCFIVSWRNLTRDLTSIFQQVIIKQKTNREPSGSLTIIIGSSSIDFSYVATNPLSQLLKIYGRNDTQGKVTAEKMREIKRLAKKVEKEANAEPDVFDPAKFEEAARKFGQLLWSVMTGVPDFNEDFAKIYGFLGCELKYLKVDFILKDSSFDVPAELLFIDKKEIKDYLIFCAPVFRQLADGAAKTEGLFDEEGEPHDLRILVIDAGNNVELEFPAGGKKQKLDFSGQEACMIKSFHRKEWHPGRRVNVEVVDVKKIKVEDKQSLWTEIRKRLRKKTFDIVHFIGHSDLLRDGQTSDLSFLLPTAGKFELVTKFEFSRALKEERVKLLFLNSCYSANKDSIFEMAKQGIPAVLGFRWAIDDQEAMNFAKIFYEKLCSPCNVRDLPIIFSETCKTYYGDRSNTIMWAAPMLVVQ